MFDTIADMAAKRAEISPDAIAFIDASSGRQWRFAEINNAANAVAAGLGQAGITHGDRLAILCLNRVEFFITLSACQKTGIILCPLNWRQPAPELVETLEPVGARRSFTMRHRLDWRRRWQRPAAFHNWRSRPILRLGSRPEQSNVQGRLMPTSHGICCLPRARPAGRRR
jgi:acyl-CoA synthetase (AMP-forming)/AMP-acid ligase II